MEHFNRLDFEREWDVVNSSHCAIITAIEQRNPMLAEAEMVKHLSYVTEKMDSIKGRAVSYTHLDVYKRQDIAPAARRRLMQKQ